MRRRRKAKRRKSTFSPITGHSYQERSLAQLIENLMAHPDVHTPEGASEAISMLD